jgi:hypothetical protein
MTNPCAGGTGVAGFVVVGSGSEPRFQYTPAEPRRTGA